MKGEVKMGLFNWFTRKPKVEVTSAKENETLELIKSLQKEIAEIKVSKTDTSAIVTTDVEPAKRKRGRPVGSKNNNYVNKKQQPKSIEIQKNNGIIHWTKKEFDFIRKMKDEGNSSYIEIAEQCNLKFHNNENVRTAPSIQTKISRENCRRKVIKRCERYTYKERKFIADLYHEGKDIDEIVEKVNRYYHKCEPVRTYYGIEKKLRVMREKAKNRK